MDNNLKSKHKLFKVIPFAMNNSNSVCSLLEITTPVDTEIQSTCVHYIIHRYCR